MKTGRIGTPSTSCVSIREGRYRIERRQTMIADGVVHMDEAVGAERSDYPVRIPVAERIGSPLVRSAQT
jgi:hypothetical protein